ncbi:MAG: hypothetical protein ACK5CE_03855 [Actinomycetes bacterium]|jgi:hypothetical protein|uniref:Unannotated protein n=1 Tax=freshwater metagenome TaxID=449393 RepID=A0A6J6D0Q4_9ZZZZ|nr:hypothetical protein [Actinomycetota bacterium]
MSDPRATITRTVVGPTSPPTASTITTTAVPSAPIIEGRLIGKRHGNMRSVGLTLSRTAADHIYALAKTHDITLGEALIHSLRRAAIETHVDDAFRRSPGDPTTTRGPRMRRGLDARTVYVLLTPDEARWISNLATERNCTVSDLATRSITTAFATSGDAGET